MIVTTIASIVIVNIIFFVEFSFFSRVVTWPARDFLRHWASSTWEGRGRGWGIAGGWTLNTTVAFIFSHNILKVTITTITLKRMISGGGQYCTWQLVTANLRLSEGFLTRSVGDYWLFHSLLKVWGGTTWFSRLLQFLVWAILFLSLWKQEVMQSMRRAPGWARRMRRETHHFTW